MSKFSPKSSNGNGVPLKEKARCAGERSLEKLNKHDKIWTLKIKEKNLERKRKKRLLKKNMAGQRKIQADLIREDQNKLNNVACLQDIKIEFGNNIMKESSFDKAIQDAQTQNQNVTCEQKNMNQHLKFGDQGELWESDSLGRGV